MRSMMQLFAGLVGFTVLIQQACTSASAWTTYDNDTLRYRSFTLSQGLTTSLPEAIVSRGSELIITDAVAPYLHIFDTKTYRSHSFFLPSKNASAVGALRAHDDQGEWFTEFVMVYDIKSPPSAHFSISKAVLARLYDSSPTLSSSFTILPSEILFPNSYIALNATHRLVSDSLSGSVWLVDVCIWGQQAKATPFIHHPLLLPPPAKTGTALGADGMRLHLTHAGEQRELDVYIGNESRGLILRFRFTYPGLEPIPLAHPSGHSHRRNHVSVQNQEPALVNGELVMRMDAPEGQQGEVDDFVLLFSEANGITGDESAVKGPAGFIWATTASAGGVELRALGADRHANSVLATWTAPEKGAVAASVFVDDAKKGCKVWIGYTTAGFAVGKLAEVELMSQTLRQRLGC